MNMNIKNVTKIASAILQPVSFDPNDERVIWVIRTEKFANKKEANEWLLALKKEGNDE